MTLTSDPRYSNRPNTLTLTILRTILAGMTGQAVASAPSTENSASHVHTSQSVHLPLFRPGSGASVPGYPKVRTDPGATPLLTPDKAIGAAAAALILYGCAAVAMMF